MVWHYCSLVMFFIALSNHMWSFCAATVHYFWYFAHARIIGIVFTHSSGLSIEIPHRRTQTLVFIFSAVFHGVNQREWHSVALLCWCAVKNLLIHSLTCRSGTVFKCSHVDTHAKMFSQVTLISRATDDPKCVCLVHNIPLADCVVSKSANSR